MSMGQEPGACTKTSTDGPGWTDLAGSTLPDMYNPAMAPPYYHHPGYTSAAMACYRCAMPRIRESKVSWGSKIRPHSGRDDLEINIRWFTGHNLMESVVCCSLKKYTGIG